MPQSSRPSSSPSRSPPCWYGLDTRGRRSGQPEPDLSSMQDRSVGRLAQQRALGDLKAMEIGGLHVTVQGRLVFESFDQGQQQRILIGAIERREQPAFELARGGDELARGLLQLVELPRYRSKRDDHQDLG